MPMGAKGWDEVSKRAKRCQRVPKGAKRCQRVAKSAKGCQRVPKCHAQQMIAGNQYALSYAPSSTIYSH